MNQSVSEEVYLNAFKDFLGDGVILIVDTSASIRAAIMKFVNERFGLLQGQIKSVGDYAAAEAIIKSENVAIVISEYFLDSRCGLELASTLREIQAPPSESLFMIMANNAQESVVIEAADENVDGFLVKPFTMNSVGEWLLKLAYQRQHPSNYKSMISAGCADLNQQKYKQAIDFFNLAKTFSSKPALACYYEGYAYSKLNESDRAEESYRQGLSYNQIHYKCLVGLYELYVFQKKLKEAYGVIKILAQEFPLSPPRLSEVIDLAVRTENYKDIDGYYERFLELDERRDELVRFVNAALVVGGIYQMEKKEFSRGIDLFKKAIVTSKRKPSVLKKTISECLKFGLAVEAAGILSKFESRDAQTPEYLVSQYLVADASADPRAVFQNGRNLVVSGVKDLDLYLTQFKRAQEFEFSEWSDELAERIERFWPGKISQIRVS
jgi:tetratricopeptide (TPR) repeat protein